MCRERLHQDNDHRMNMLGRLRRASASRLFQLVKWVAIIDPSCCDKCRSLDGHVFRADDPDWERFVPPVHPGCRCRIAVLTLDQQKKAKPIPVAHIERILNT